MSQRKSYIAKTDIHQRVIVPGDFIMYAEHDELRVAMVVDELPLSGLIVLGVQYPNDPDPSRTDRREERFTRYTKSNTLIINDLDLIPSDVMEQIRSVYHNRIEEGRSNVAKMSRARDKKAPLMAVAKFGRHPDGSIAVYMLTINTNDKYPTKYVRMLESYMSKLGVTFNEGRLQVVRSRRWVTKKDDGTYSILRDVSYSNHYRIGEQLRTKYPDAHPEYFSGLGQYTSFGYKPIATKMFSLNILDRNQYDEVDIDGSLCKIYVSRRFENQSDLEIHIRKENGVEQLSRSTQYDLVRTV